MATRTLFKVGFFCAVVAFLLMFLAFATPYWYKSWTRVHSPFSNIGLWHVCLAGYIQQGDPNMKSYVGCWWIHSSEFSEVAGTIQPPWFRGIQALSIFTLLCDLVAGIVLIFNIPDVTYKKIYNTRRVTILFVAAVLELISAGLVFLIALVFAEMVNDKNWMPRPWMNYLSWSYGCCVLSGFFSAFSGMLIFINGLIYRDKERGVIGSSTFDERMEKIKNKEVLAAERASRPPAYSGGEGVSYGNPSIGGYPSTGYPSTGYPSTGYPSVGGYPGREPSFTNEPGYGMKMRQPSDTSSLRSREDVMRAPGPRGAPVMYQGQQQQYPRYNYGKPRSDTAETASQGSKVGESVV